MPQSRLIDVNTSAIKHRNEVSAGLDSRNYDKVIGALYSMNALLPDLPEEDGRQKYRITIDNALYEHFVKRDKIIVCPSCKKDLKIKEILIQEVLLEPIQSLLSNKTNDTIWKCPKCEVTNRLENSEVIETSLREPFFIRVVPKPPKRNEGISDRSSYHIKMIQWAWSFLQEWEASMAQFRDDNWQKTDQPMVSDDDIDGGEESDN